MSRVQCDQGQQTTPIVAECESKECLTATSQGAERLDRRSEVVSEALAEEVKRNDQTKERGRRDTPAPSSSQAAAPASHEVTETIAHEVHRQQVAGRCAGQQTRKMNRQQKYQ